MTEFTFTAQSMGYIFEHVANENGCSVRDMGELNRIAAKRSAIEQIRAIIRRKPFQKFNIHVAFIMHQYLIKRPENPDGLIQEHRDWLRLLDESGV